ncbi:LysR family transcriptional regulator [Trinickia sp. LjRoot230]|uniref:LysR family transcriptional regulator n=1 Tax=Trinickia sp. LjRoot230 TaxID=3342288 RepID=UPI003ED151D1
MRNASLPTQQELLDIEDLRLLCALAKAKSLAGAARQLKVNHASAWRRLGNLESRLGVRLFDRTRVGYSATPVGDEAIDLAQRVLRELDETARRLAGHDGRLAGIVRLTTTEALLAFITPALKTLRHLHPELLVEVVVTNSFLALTRRDADIALRPAESVPDGLVAKRLATVASAIYGASEYMADEADADPLALDWVSPDESLAHLGSARWIAKHVDPARIVHRANSLVALREMARAGIGLAPLPCFLADGDPALVRVLGPVSEMASELWLVAHPDLRRMPRVRVAMRVVAEYVAENRDRIEATGASFA